MSGASGSAGWAQLRQQARSLESQTLTEVQTESLFHTYSQFSTAPNIPSKPTAEEEEVESKLEEVLTRRDGVISQLSRLLESEASLSTSALKQSNLSLLREKLGSHRRDLTRLRTTLSQARDRANLLSNVRTEIDEYRAANPEAEYMLGERSRIDASHEAADGVLSRAYAVNESLVVQRETLAGIQRRITLAASHVPGVNSLIGRITTKKRRDGIIMGCLIGVCFILFFWFL